MTIESGIISQRARTITSPATTIANRPVTVGLAGRTRDNHRSLAKLRTMQRGHVLQNQLRWISARSVIVPLDVKANHVVSFREKSFRPSTQSAKQNNR